MQNLKGKIEIAILITVTLLLLVPFINKAIHIDDTVRIYHARQIMKSPQDPFGYKMNWYGKDENVLGFEGNAPLIPYYMALVQKFFKESEYCLHISFLIFAIISSLSIFYLGKLLGINGFLASLMLITTPAFAVMATDLMPDVPFLSLSLLAILTFFHSLKKENMSLAFITGLLVGIVSLTKYVGLILLPLFSLFVLLVRSRLRILIPIWIVALSIFLVWCLQNLCFYNGLHIVHAAKFLYFDSPLLAEKILGTLGYLGIATLFPSILLFTALEMRFRYLFCFIVAIIIGILCPKFVPTADYKGVDSVFLSISVSVGLFICLRTVSWISTPITYLLKNKISSWDYAVEIFLFLWFWCILVFNIFAEFAAVRFILIQVPPLILLLLKKTNPSGINPKIMRWIWISGAGMNLILSLLVSYGDYSYANTYRDFAHSFSSRIDEKGKKSNIYFSAHWGFQYYMEKEGYTCFSPRIDNPEKGDVLIIPVIASYDIPIDVSSKEQLENYLGRRLKLIGVVEYNTPFPVRTMHRKAHAGFYSHGWGFLPFAFSREYLEKFYIWEFM